MKRILIGLLMVGSLGFLSEVAAQDWGSLSKQERKAVKKELRRLSEEEYYEMKQSMQAMGTELESQRATIAGKDQQISTLMQEKNTLSDQVSSLEAQLAEAQQKLAEREAQPQRPQPQQQAQQPSENRTRTETGVLFKVQIGAFRQKDLSKYFDNHPNFAGEITEDGTQQITLGQFRNYWEADQFKKYLRDMGVKDAWIVPYKDGERVPLKDVLEGVIY